jgi:osmoprotectant transport system permease protein
MSLVGDTIDYLADGDRWSGSSGIWQRLTEHVGYTAAVIAVASVVALPLGVAIGHQIGRRGRSGVLGRLVTGVAFGARALPTFGLFLLAVTQWPGSPLSVWPVLIVLVVLALPPILANIVVGVAEVSPGARDAARGMGMTGWQVVRAVEVPLALPLVLSGIRSATLQVVATIPIAAYSGQGTLGRLLIDGIATRNFGQAAAGATVIIVLALVLELIFATIGRRIGTVTRRKAA